MGTKKANTCELGMYALSDLPNGEFVKLKAAASKVYYKVGYNRTEKKFELQDCDDVNHIVFRKGTVVVQAGFTY